MFETIHIRYFHPAYNIGMADIRNVWLLNEQPVRINAALHRGALVFRLPGGKRVSYRSLKKGLIKKKIILRQPLQVLPF
jgi:hypothetical protein